MFIDFLVFGFCCIPNIACCLISRNTSVYVCFYMFLFIYIFCYNYALLSMYIREHVFQLVKLMYDYTKYQQTTFLMISCFCCSPFTRLSMAFISFHHFHDLSWLFMMLHVAFHVFLKLFSWFVIISCFHDGSWFFMIVHYLSHDSSWFVYGVSWLFHVCCYSFLIVVIRFKLFLINFKTNI